VAKALRSAFLHAFRFDGSISSICRRCQITIASKPNEIDLRNPEDAHICSDFSMRGMLHPEFETRGEN
jgi:hypothetical protein